MRNLHAIARQAAKARKALAYHVASEAEDLPAKARKRLERRTRAARRASVEALRAADAWEDFAGA